jgi:hypothetical protein
MKTVMDETNLQGKSIRERAEALGRTMKKYKGRARACDKILELAGQAEFPK